MAHTDAASALQMLITGNRRYMAGELAHPRHTVERRTALAAGQQPFAVVIGCSDSRVPPEIIFDCGLGDLFVVRVAGNLLDDLGQGSIEYAVEHLGVRLVVVLGHTDCGAVAATVAGGYVPGHIASLTAGLRPALALAQAEPGDLHDNTVRCNVRRSVERLQATLPVVTAGSQNREAVRVIGAVYHVEDGKVEILS